MLSAVARHAARLVRERPALIVALSLLATAGFVAALALIPSYPSSDSFDADNEVVRALDRMESDLPPRGFVVPMLVLGADGNVLTREAFDEVLAREQALRDDPVAAPLVYEFTDPNLRMTVSSVWSLPDTLRAVMNGDTPLAYAVGWHELVGGPGTTYEAATDEEWYDALDRLLSFRADDGSRPFQRALSEDAARGADGRWSARSMFGGGSFDNALLFEHYERDPAKATPERPYFEEFQLHVDDVLSRDASRTEWLGIALGINTEIEKEVAESSRLVALAVLVIGVVLYLSLRNWRDFAVSLLTLPLLIVWMTGAARLLGLSNNQFTAMLPILILALGVDYAIHGVRRYREERGAHAPADAVTRSVSLLGPALMLACATTAAAFFSNAGSPIPGLRDWGIEGGVGIVSALWICGVFAPALRYLWDRRRVARGRMDDGARASLTADRLREGTFLGRLAVASSRRPLAVLALVALITAPATVLALGITTSFNANDFFDSESELLRNLAVVQRDFPDEGEPAFLLVEADLSEPRVVSALARGVDALPELGYAPEADYTLPAVVRTFMQNPEENGASFEDADGDDVPDRREDLRDLLTRALRDGVFVRVEVPPGPPVPGAPVGPLPPPVGGPRAERVLAYAPDTVRELVHPTGNGGFDLTVVIVGIPNTDDFDVLPVAKDRILGAFAGVSAEDEARLVLTGEPYKRFEQVGAITTSLKVSVSVSIILCFLIVLAAFRNVPHALVTLTPVVLLVPWLYGFMNLAGMSLNLVTATIAAMSIGVGVDYSLHLSERYREEVRHGRAPDEALRRSMDSSGLALLGSVTSTVSGFLVLLLAPMPLFRTFGLLTAAMAAASFLAAVLVLPPLLVLVERRLPRRVPVLEPVPASPPEVTGAR